MRICRKCQKLIEGEGRICRACGSILDKIPNLGSPAEKSDSAAPDPSKSFPRLAAGTRSAHSHPPLGLPSGSIRAFLTLLIVAVVIVQSVRGQEIDMLWTETLMIALAHYFTSRRFVRLPPEVIDHLKKEGRLETERIRSICHSTASAPFCCCPLSDLRCTSTRSTNFSSLLPCPFWALCLRTSWAWCCGSREFEDGRT